MTGKKWAGAGGKGGGKKRTNNTFPWSKFARFRRVFDERKMFLFHFFTSFFLSCNVCYLKKQKNLATLLTEATERSD